MLGVSAQRESLTDEFAYLNAKERSKIAKQERIDAVEDTVFIKLMEGGEVLFREREYEAALEKFQAARKRRPYNVNPKVKIEDLEALLKQREEQQSQKMEVPSPGETTGSKNKGDQPILRKNTPPEARSITASKQPIGVTSVMPDEELPPANPRNNSPDIEQRIFIQGTARVLERIVLDQNREATYRKVTHEWGAIYYFKGNNTITKRTWDEVFSR